jgi:hypothetical protein
VVLQAICSANEDMFSTCLAGSFPSFHLIVVWLTRGMRLGAGSIITKTLGGLLSALRHRHQPHPLFIPTAHFSCSTDGFLQHLLSSSLGIRRSSFECTCTLLTVMTSVLSMPCLINTSLPSHPDTYHHHSLLRLYGRVASLACPVTCASGHSQPAF